MALWVIGGNDTKNPVFLDCLAYIYARKWVIPLPAAAEADQTDGQATNVTRSGNRCLAIVLTFGSQPVELHLPKCVTFHLSRSTQANETLLKNEFSRFCFIR